MAARATCLSALSGDSGKTIQSSRYSYASKCSGTGQSHLTSRTSSLIWVVFSDSHSLSMSLSPASSLLAQPALEWHQSWYQSPFLLPSHNLFISARASEIPSPSPTTFEVQNAPLALNVFASASGEVSQLQTPFLPADSAGLISLAFSFPTVHKGAHLNASQTPCSGSCTGHMLFSLCILLKVWYSAMHRDFRVTVRINKVHRDTFSFLTFDYHTCIMCGYAAIFLMLTEI